MERKSTILQNEAEIDLEIEHARKLFYSSLMDKKRSIKRKWLEVGSITNEHLIATLPYRAMLNRAVENPVDVDEGIVLSKEATGNGQPETFVNNEMATAGLIGENKIQKGGPNS